MIVRTCVERERRRDRERERERYFGCLSFGMFRRSQEYSQHVSNEAGSFRIDRSM